MKRYMYDNSKIKSHVYTNCKFMLPKVGGKKTSWIHLTLKTDTFLFSEIITNFSYCQFHQAKWNHCLCCRQSFHTNHKSCRRTLGWGTPFQNGLHRKWLSTRTPSQWSDHEKKKKRHFSLEIFWSGGNVIGLWRTWCAVRHPSWHQLYPWKDTIFFSKLSEKASIVHDPQSEVRLNDLII